MIVTHVAEYASGGVATYLKNLIDEQIKNKNISKIYLFCSSTKSDFNLLDFQSDKVSVIKYKYKRNLAGILKLLTLALAIKRKRTDIIHLHSTFAGLLRLTLALCGCRKKIIYCSHGWAFNKETSTINKYMYMFVEKMLSFLCNKIINISDNEALSARFIKEKKMITIKNSIPDVKQMKSTKSSGDFYRNLVFIGRLDKQKGIDLLIKAVDKINKKHNNILKLTVIGDSVIDDEIIEKSDINGVEFLGWQSAANVQKMLVQSKALIIPSRWEGFGLTALEAMRASKMVLASDAGALPEIILNKTTGLIFRKDSIESLEEVLESFILLSQNEIEEYGKKGRERYITYFNYSNFVDEINNLYGEVVKSE